MRTTSEDLSLVMGEVSDLQTRVGHLEGNVGEIWICVMILAFAGLVLGYRAEDKSK